MIVLYEKCYRPAFYPAIVAIHSERGIWYVCLLKGCSCVGNCLEGSCKTGSLQDCAFNVRHLIACVALKNYQLRKIMHAQACVAIILSYSLDARDQEQNEN